MATCFYHASVEASGNCLGCKNPICDDCKAAGKMGFCGPCLEKVTALSSAVADIKKTGVVAGKKATIVKTVRKAKTGQLAADRCFHHFEVKAVGTCTVCGRIYCPACLNEETNVCYHCETLDEESRALAEARERRRAAREAAAAPADLQAVPPSPVAPAAPPASPPAAAVLPPPPPRPTGPLPPAPPQAPAAFSPPVVTGHMPQAHPPQVVVQTVIPPWIYAVGGVLVGALLMAIVMLLRH